MRKIATLLFIFLLLQSCQNFDQSPSSSLENNLGNLNGEWYWHNKKQQENWWLILCYDEKSKQGTYELWHKYDDWGSDKKNDLKKMDEGNFTLTEGFDMYRGRAYVGKKNSNGPNVFAITQIDNRYAVDWFLRLSTIEDEMFGEGMTKTSNSCDSE